MVHQEKTATAKASATAAAAASTGPATTHTEIPRERAHFRALLALNPNYFGTLAQAPLAPVMPKAGDTTYEEIGCVGFHPQARRLDAVIFVKQPSGYGGGLCSAGTPECVRFYLSFDHGKTWVDQGSASCTVYDVDAAATHQQRLEYAVSVPCAPPQKFCATDNQVLARAILSWNVCPPPGQPDWVPVWGEVHDTHIEVQPLKLLPWHQFVQEAGVKLPALAAQTLDLDQPAVLKPGPELGVAELHALYRDKGVEPHRYALPAVQKLLAQPGFGSGFAALPPKGLFAEIGLDLASVIGVLVSPPDGSTYYEQLECVGFNPVTSELVGVLRLKRPNGYSGGLCTAGSREYVTFWADLDRSGSFETCLGTASVQVFDVPTMPQQGLEYSVYLPVNFSALRQPCQQGPRLVPIRAILSWATPAPCAAPNQPPVWGNHEDTLVLVPPGTATHPGDFRPVLFNISTVAVCDIDPNTGLAAGERPFGGAVYIVGDIPGADSLTTPDRIKYRLSVRQLPGGGWQPVANDFAVTLDHYNAGLLTQTPFMQQVDGAGYYTWRDFGIGTGTWRRVAAPFVGLLGQWNTGVPMMGRWEIRVEALDTLTNTPYLAETTFCPDGSTRQNAVVALDELPPVPAIAITDVSTDGGLTWQPAADCGNFAPGVWLRGTYSVSDEHFGALDLNVEPPGPAHGAKPVHGVPPATTPFPRSYPAVPTAGETATWTLDTTGMDPCGYVVRIDTGDRTIVSASGGWTAAASVGFCLRAAEAA